MSYYFNKEIKGISFEDAIDKVTKELEKEGFGVITEIDVKATMKKKLDIDFRNYKILGACNPHFAHNALQSDDKIGALLPCNVVVQELKSGDIEVFAADPIETMGMVDNEDLKCVANDVRTKLKVVIDSL